MMFLIKFFYDTLNKNLKFYDILGRVRKSSFAQQSIDRASHARAFNLSAVNIVSRN